MRERPTAPRVLGHALHSVHPVAQRSVPALFLRNERQVTTLTGDRFGPLALVEVGAMCVGRIVQTYTPGQAIACGDEKGYFAFGGSTTILVTAGSRVQPDEDLLERTAGGVESLVRVGEGVGRSCASV